MSTFQFKYFALCSFVWYSIVFWNQFVFECCIWNIRLLLKIVIYPASIRLDEDVLKTSWRRLSFSSSEDVLIKTNMLALALRLQKTSWRRLDDVLVKTSIFVLAICLQDVFKTSLKRLQDVFNASSRHLQDVLQRYVFKAHHQVKLFA